MNSGLIFRKKKLRLNFKTFYITVIMVGATWARAIVTSQTGAGDAFAQNEVKIIISETSTQQLQTILSIHSMWT